ncbi:MAG TPA: hypothetical protein V6D43_08455 [Candidatus Sericytochromatia bacterium]|jgi:hypothetical protein
MVSAIKNVLTVLAVAIGGKNGNNDGKDDNKKNRIEQRLID